MNEPSIGRIVHFTDYENTSQRTYAAIVTAVPFENNPGGMRACLGVFIGVPGRDMMWTGATPYSETPKPGHWSWPPRA